MRSEYVTENWRLLTLNSDSSRHDEFQIRDVTISEVHTKLFEKAWLKHLWDLGGCGASLEYTGLNSGK